MDVFKFNPVTFELIEKHTCQKSPLEKDVFLKPPNTTPKIPPVTSKNEVAVFYDGAWLIKTDFRGCESFNDSGVPVHITEIGESVKESPPKDYLKPKFNGSDWEETATEEEILSFYVQKMRLERNFILAESDQMMLSDHALYGLDSVLVYRQALKDMPQVHTTIEQVKNPVWPVKP